MNHSTGQGPDVADPRHEAFVRLTVNDEAWEGRLDVRTSVLDALLTDIGVTSVKKGCDHGQCGACTVLVDGRRILSCLALAASYDGAEVTTSEGLGTVDHLSPLQAAFIDHDGLQCGYCTPGQICSAEGMLAELQESAQAPGPTAGSASAGLTEAEIRERMSGNLCRCGAYVNIVAAVSEVAETRGLRS